MILLIIYWLIRLSLGGVIVAAGIGKFLDVKGFVGVIDTYKFNLPRPVAWIIAVLVSAFELSLGIWILSGYQLYWAAIASIFMHAGYAVLLTITLARGIKLNNCGCFGVFLARPLRWFTPLEDVALIIVSYVLLKLI